MTWPVSRSGIAQLALRKRTWDTSGSSATEEGQHNAPGPCSGLTPPVASLLAGLILHSKCCGPAIGMGRRFSVRRCGPFVASAAVGRVLTAGIELC